MKRIIALSVLASAVIAAGMFVLWSAKTPRRAVQRDDNSASTGTSTFPQIKTAPTVAAHETDVATDVAEWPRFMAACRAKDFAMAEQLLPTVLGVPHEARLEMLVLPRELNWSDDEASVLRRLAAQVLAARNDEEANAIEAGALAEFRRCWPKLAELGELRKESLEGLVDCMPLNVPEREALPAGDYLLVDGVVRSARRPNTSALETLRMLLETGAAKPVNERPYFEPLLSALVYEFFKSHESEAKVLAQEFADRLNLTVRLRWELRVCSLGNSKVLARFIEAVDGGKTKIGQALHDALREGLTAEELLLAVVPYLESRFGAREAASVLVAGTFRWLSGLSAEQRAAFGKAVAEQFENAEPGGGLASVHFRLLDLARGTRDAAELRNVMFELEPDTSRETPIVPAEGASQMRDAILKHRAKSLELPENDPLPIVNLADLCDIAVQCSANLAEALAALEQLLDKRKPLENYGLRLGFGRVLMRCRSRFAVELANDFPARERLIHMAEQVLEVTLDEFKAGGSLRRDGLEHLLVFADQLLALCAITPEIPVSSKSAGYLRNIVTEFEEQCFDWQSNPPVIKPAFKRYLDPYARVTARLKDTRLAPAR